MFLLWIQQSVYEKLFAVDWEKIFVPESSMLELVIRGTLMYFALFLTLRFLRRGIGGIGIADLLVVVIIADAAQNGMTGDYKSITEGLVLVSTIAAWDMILDYLGFQSPTIERFLRPRPLPLIKNGIIIRRNMRRETVTEEELFAQLRLQGILNIKKVKEARLEGDGKLSIIKFERSDDENNDKNPNSDMPAIG
ncbi:MAG: DUF421 domain-containing protein [Acidobacteriota bacterium]|nr:DUF421 domain-containing protein [Acidobacteriota bacterium]